MLNCLLITIFFVIVIDQLHFVDEITEIISGWMTNGLIKKPMNIKPISCSVCMSWWVNLAYIIIVGHCTIPMILYIVGLSWCTPIINSLLSFVRNAVIKLINTVSEKINI